MPNPHLVVLAILAIATTQCFTVAIGGVRRDDYGTTDDSDYLSLGSAPEYASVGQVHATYPEYPNDPAFASGVLIADRWVLTAGHVVGRLPIVGTPSAVEFAIDGTTYSAAEWFPEPSFSCDCFNEIVYGHDIGLIRLNNSVPSVAFAQRYTGTDEQNAVATIVGFGNQGEGSYGAILNTFGAKRAGHNIIDQFYGTPNRYGPAFVDNYLAADFDNPGRVSDSTMGDSSPLPMEYMIASGDSGGGVFIEVNGTTYLAGINSFIRRGPGESSSDENLDSDYGDVQYFTRVSMLNGWINDHLSSVYWTGDYNGLFQEAANWEAGHVPDTNNIAVFNKTGSYTVTMGSDAHNEGLRVSQGNATLDLGGNAYTLSDTLAQPSISVGSPQSATLTISNGSLSAVDAELGSESYGVAGNLIAGAGAVLTFSGSVSFRSAGGAAVAMELVVNNGATLYADSVIIPGGPGTGAKLVVDGTVTVRSLQIGTSLQDSLPLDLINGTGDLSITGESDWYTGRMSGSGKTVITESGFLTIHMDSKPSNFDYPKNFRPIDNHGTITTFGAGIFQIGSILNNKALALIDIADNTSFKFGILNNETDGLVRKSGGSGSSTFDQTTINNIGTLQVESGTLILTGAVPQLSGSTLTGGTWNILNGSALSITTGSNVTSLGANATVRLSGATAAFDKINSLNTNNGRFQIDDGKNFSAVGAFTNNGTLTVGSGSMMSAAGTLTNNGRIEGSGSLAANITSQGIISPGQSTGALTINGNASLLNNSQIDIELGGVVPGTEYDRLIITGLATLNGQLHLNLINGFMSTNGNSFDIFDWGGAVNGMFTTLDLPLLTGGLEWITSQLYTAGVLTVGLPGDFNFDSVVDMADYIVWRKFDGTPGGYNTWRENFSRTLNNSSSAFNTPDAQANVPEPAGLVLLAFAVLVSPLQRAFGRRRIAT